MCEPSATSLGHQLSPCNDSIRGNGTREEEKTEVQRGFVTYSWWSLNLGGLATDFSSFRTQTLHKCPTPLSWSASPKVCLIIGKKKKKKRETELGGEKRCGLLKEFCVSLNSFLQLSVSSKPLEVKEALAQQLGNVGSNPVSH